MLLAAACVGWFTPAASAQALLELTDAPRPGFPSSWEVTEISAHADVKGQSASVRLSQEFKNTGSRPLEARLLFPVPPQAAVRELTLLVDGKELTGELQKAGDARATYEAIVRRNRDPALLEYAGYGLYRTSVFPIPAGKTRTVQLRYTQLLGVREGLVDLTLPIGSAGSNGKGAKKVEVSAAIETKSPLKVVYSPSHPMDVERPTDKTARAELTLKNVTRRENVRLLFGTSEGLVGLNALAFRDPDGKTPDGKEATDDDGFFLLLAAPDVPEPDAAPPARSVVLVIDTSGSMAGEKMEQARNAASFIVGRMRKSDTFNVIAYSSSVTSFRPELEKGDADGRKAGQAFVENLRSGGGTDINSALTKALEMIPPRSKDGAGDRPTYVLFLTDGKPTSGVTDEQEIASNVAEANDAKDDDGKVKARLFSFGVGYDVNARLLDRLSEGGRGVSAYVAPEEDVEASVSELYAKIAAPVLTNLKLAFARNGSDADSKLNRILPGALPDLFAGQQLSIVGRYVTGGKDLKGEFTLTGKSTGSDGEQMSFSLPVTLPADSDDTADFLPAFWATRRIGELLSKIDLEGENEELVEELVALSTRYGILTPYTAFLAEEDVDVRDLATNSGVARRRLGQLEVTDGRSGFEQRSFNQSLRRSGQASDNLGLDAISGFGDRAGGPPTSAPAAPRGGGFGGGGLGGGRLGESEALAAEPTDEVGEKARKAAPATRVQRVAGQTLYFKNGQWEDSALTDDQRAKPTKVEQFTDAWFKLAKATPERLAPLLTQSEPALVRINDVTYLITPPDDAAASEESAG